MICYQNSELGCCIEAEVHRNEGRGWDGMYVRLGMRGKCRVSLDVTGNKESKFYRGQIWISLGSFLATVDIFL